MKVIKKLCLTAALFIFALASLQAQYVTVRKDSNGWRLLDGNKPVEVKGIVWSYTPIGETHSYNLWTKDDAFIMQMIDTDMPMLKAMGVNTIRCFSNVPARWIEYIYTKYGIYTIINDLLGRYGVSVNGAWYSQTDYSDLYTRQVLIEQARKTADTYRGVKGVLMYMFGNESNYGLVWSGSDIENLPVGEQDTVKAGYLYSLLEEAMAVCKDTDPLRPVGFINGDTQYLELIAKLCPSLDILGVNAYRGFKFYDSFYENIAEILDKPVIFTEAGADAYNAILQQEDQYAQMKYLESQWKEIYGQSYGKGKTGNMLGGCLFEWVDEWWKHYQYKDLDVHNTVGTWANAGYELDYADGVNNMDEEWFGLCAQSKITVRGINKRIPRAAYYLMQDVWALSMYTSTPAQVEARFSSLDTNLYLARGNEKSLKETFNEKSIVQIDYFDTTVRSVSGIDFDDVKEKLDKGNWKDSLNAHISAESTIGLTVQPLESLTATAALRVWSDSPYTRLGDTWASYYTRNKKDFADGTGKNQTLQYVDLYSSSVTYDNPYFELNGFYHTGHGSFENTGDIFNISREAYDVITCDIDGSKAPIGVEFRGKQILEGLTIIGGPQIWEDAKAQIMANYYKRFPSHSVYAPSFALGLMYTEELEQAKNVNIAPYTAFGSGRKASIYGEAVLDPWVTLKLGFLHSGSEKWGAVYATDAGKLSTITWADTLGGYAQLGTSMFQHSYIYANAIYRGLVADTNGGAVRNGFFSSDSGSGNRFEMQLGADLAYGSFSLKPVVRARFPLQKPAGRSLLSNSPFIVGLGNRQAIEFEAVLTYDPEGVTWFYEWNSNDIENANFAASLAGLYTFYAGKTDIIPFKSADYSKTYNDGDFLWYNGMALPVQKNLWQIGGRIVSNPVHNLRLVGTFDVGSLGSTGNSETIVNFWKVGLAARYKHWIAKATYLSNCWGDEQWWRTFNFTFPHQWTFDLAYGFKTPLFMEDTNRIGIKMKGRSFGPNSSDAYKIWPTGTVLDGKTYMEITLYMNIRL